MSDRKRHIHTKSQILETMGPATKCAQVSLAVLLACWIALAASQAVELDKEGVPIPCIDNGKFYRNPIAANTRQDCGKYYQCYDNKVISFRCNSDLYFDVDRQICDFKLKVSNCDKSHGKL